jgi:hypothetical protein
MTQLETILILPKKLFIYKAPEFESENIEVWFDINNKVERVTMPKGLEF